MLNFSSSSKKKNTCPILPRARQDIQSPAINNPSNLSSSAASANSSYITIDMSNTQYNATDIPQPRQLSDTTKRAIANELANINRSTSTDGSQECFDIVPNIARATGEGIGNLGVGAANLGIKAVNLIPSKDIKPIEVEYKKAPTRKLSADTALKIMKSGDVNLENMYKARLSAGYIATAIYRDESSKKIVAYDPTINIILQILQKNGMKLPEVGNADIPVIFKLYDSKEESKNSFKEAIFNHFADSMIIEETKIKDPKNQGQFLFLDTQTGKVTKQAKSPFAAIARIGQTLAGVVTENKAPKPIPTKAFETKESIIFTAAKAAIISGENGFGKNAIVNIKDDNDDDKIIDSKPAYEFLASNHIEVYSNAINENIATTIMQHANNGSIKDNIDLRAKLSALKIIGLSIGEQVNFKELLGILVVAASIGSLGEFAGEQIKHLIESKTHSHGIGIGFAAGVPRGIAVGIIDLIENALNGWAITSAELQKMGVSSITGEGVFGDKYKNMSPFGKIGAWGKLAFTGNTEGAEGKIASTVANMLNSAVKGAGIGFVVSYAPLVALSRDYEHDSIGQFLSINMIATVIVVACTALSIPLEERNIIDRSLAAFNHAHHSEIVNLIDNTDTIEKAQSNKNKIVEFFKHSPLSPKKELSETAEELPNLKQKIYEEVKQSITSSVAGKSSIKAFMSVWTLSLIWTVHEKVIKGGIPDAAARYLLMGLVAPYENIWRSMYVGVDLFTLEKRMNSLQNKVLHSVLSGNNLSNEDITNSLAVFGITNKYLFPILDNLTLGASNTKAYLTAVFNGNQWDTRPRNNIDYAGDGIKGNNIITDEPLSQE